MSEETAEITNAEATEDSGAAGSAPVAPARKRASKRPAKKAAKKSAKKRSSKKASKRGQAKITELADAYRMPFGALDVGERFIKPGGHVMVKHDEATAVCELHGATETYAPETVVEAVRKHAKAKK